MEIIVKGFNNSSGTFGESCTCDCNCNCNCVYNDLGDKVFDDIQCAKKGKFDWGYECTRHTPSN
ncbi:hypothetical protein [Clostridium sp. Marseille-QA1073]